MTDLNVLNVKVRGVSAIFVLEVSKESLETEFFLLKFTEFLERLLDA